MALFCRKPFSRPIMIRARAAKAKRFLSFRDPGVDDYRGPSLFTGTWLRILVLGLFSFISVLRFFLFFFILAIIYLYVQITNLSYRTL